jgi:hypothetical protein
MASASPHTNFQLLRLLPSDDRDKPNLASSQCPTSAHPQLARGLRHGTSLHPSRLAASKKNALLCRLSSCYLPASKQYNPLTGKRAALERPHVVFFPPDTCQRGDFSHRLNLACSLLYLAGELSRPPHEPSSPALGIVRSVSTTFAQGPKQLFLFASKNAPWSTLTQSSSPNQLVLLSV